MTHSDEYNTTVSVETTYIAEQSDPDNERYAFAYTITIKNEGSVPAKLVTRHWVITDADGNTQEVRGDGVVGEQPHLNPGEGFQYTSGTLLDTPVGSMHGSYSMRAEDGTEFEAPIPLMRLHMPNSVH